MRKWPISNVLRRAAVAFAAVAVAAPLIAVRADASIYWSVNPGPGGGRIGRAANDGTSPNPALMSGLFGAGAVAVAGPYLYWANGPGSIGRANLDGSSPNPTFITPPASGGTFSANAIAVDPVNGYIFWADSLNTRIGRANLADGSAVNLALVSSTLNYATGVVADSATKTVYWTVNNNAGQGLIGQANEDGTNPQRTWKPGLFGAQGITSDGTYLYWANGPNEIGRVGLDGSGLIPAWITSARVGTKFGSAVNTPVPLVVGGGYIYYADLFDGYVGRVPNTQSATATNYFVTALGSATGLAWTPTLTSPGPGPLPPPTVPDVDLLKADVQRVELPRGIERSLLAQLDAFGAAMDAGDHAAACDRLASYANHVDALAGKKIPQSPADGLLADAQMIGKALSCPPTD
jgi:hypothetical protein